MTKRSKVEIADAKQGKRDIGKMGRKGGKEQSRSKEEATKDGMERDTSKEYR